MNALVLIFMLVVRRRLSSIVERKPPPHLVLEIIQIRQAAEECAGLQLKCCGV